MSDSNIRPAGGSANKASKRSLPSWMSSRENEDENNGKKPTWDGEDEKRGEGDTPSKSKGHGKGHMDRSASKQPENGGKSSASSLESRSFNKLLEGVVFVLSGFVNPERSILRSRALEMGAEYQPDWNSGCTLLVCAFPNTPKFRQVEADCGTIISKDWILECYAQRKLVDIESYLMHAGKPWRRGNKSHQDNEAQIPSPPKQVGRGSPSKPSASTKSKAKDANPAKKPFSPSEVKKWAIDDLNRTIQWLESQEEKPYPSEITKIAAEGILTCLQDAILSLKEKQDVQKATEDWKFIPRIVEELAKFDETGSNVASMSKEDLLQQALNCQRIYEAKLNSLDDNRRRKSDTSEQPRKTGRTKAISSGAAEYDSDETIEMTEEEIDLACRTLTL
ncbi:hypothetical protein L6164_004426 [Bauhinia variegata]|uniref:Uncharacterized protein n=1 Tax=Bauhinia variegata TaxID=167791 RepID=A0ACB9Q3I0_BAUVA|nr:hypothetical protein L6164_004426 [Bauhinia variegata]